MQPIVEAPKVEIPSALIVSQPIVSFPAMSIDLLKILGRILRSTPPRFCRSLSKGTLTIMTFGEYRLNNFGLVETHGVDNTIFKIDFFAQHWWIDYHNLRIVGSPLFDMD